jgi:hypothetical protein
MGALQEALIAKFCMNSSPQFEITLPTHTNYILLPLHPLPLVLLFLQLYGLRFLARPQSELTSESKIVVRTQLEDHLGLRMSPLEGTCLHRTTQTQEIRTRDPNVRLIDLSATVIGNHILVR